MDKELLTSFGNRCRALRGSVGLSQEKFANSIGMDRSYYASIETGMRNVTLGSMSKIAQGLNISLSDLLDGVDCPHEHTQ